MIARSAPLQRTPLKPRPRRPKPGDDPDYRYFLKNECKCCVCVKLPAAERPRLYWIVDAAHTGRNGGMGLKAPDRTCVPLCRSHHDERDKGMAGKFEFDEKWNLTHEAEVHYAAFLIWKEGQC